MGVRWLGASGKEGESRNEGLGNGEVNVECLNSEFLTWGCSC